MSITTVKDNLMLVYQRIIAAEYQFSRNSDEVKLLAVSKGQSVEQILMALAAGQRAFGENYLQEALEKITVLGREGIEWHFIGAIQGNKTNLIAQNFDWVHTVSRHKIATRLNAAREGARTPLNVCIQVNIRGETSKGGCAPSEVAQLAAIISDLPYLHLRGLMAIPVANQTISELHDEFHTAHQLFVSLQQAGHVVDTLSIGMSADLDVAIANGATLIRVGTAIFGERER
jgi:PLP dependent protein